MWNKKGRVVDTEITVNAAPDSAIKSYNVEFKTPKRDTKIFFNTSIPASILKYGKHSSKS